MNSKRSAPSLLVLRIGTFLLIHTRKEDNYQPSSSDSEDSETDSSDSASTSISSSFRCNPRPPSPLSMEGLLGLVPEKFTVDSGSDCNMNARGASLPPPANKEVGTPAVERTSGRPAASSPSLRETVPVEGGGESSAHRLRCGRANPSGKRPKKDEPIMQFLCGAEIFEEDTALGKQGIRNAQLMLGTTLLPKDHNHFKDKTNKVVHEFGSQLWYQLAAYVEENKHRLKDAEYELLAEKNKASTNISRLKSERKKNKDLVKEMEELKKAYNADIEKARSEAIAEEQANSKALVEQMKDAVAKFKQAQRASFKVETSRLRSKANSKMTLLEAKISRLKYLLQRKGVLDYEIEIVAAGGAVGGDVGGDAGGAAGSTAEGAA